MGIIYKKIIALLAATALLLSLAACGGNFAISFATDIIDGVTVTESAYVFTASAISGGKACRVTVTCNGEALTKQSNGKYAATLKRGANTIGLEASAGSLSESRAYTVSFYADFDIETDLDGYASIFNDAVSFNASATFNGDACALIVRHNGETVTGEGDAYSVMLVIGGNNIVLTARSGDNTETREVSIDYSGMAINTDLRDADTAGDALSFKAGATYGKAACALTATHNGTELTPNGNDYSVTLSPGENRFVLTACEGSVTKTVVRNVYYCDDPATIEASITDGKTYRGSIFSFDVIARDGLGRKLSYDKISFSVAWGLSGGGFNALTAGISKVWDDSTLSGFRLNFKNPVFDGHASFRLRITAVDAFGKTVSSTYGMTYAGVEAGEAIGEVVLAIEGFSISCGYFAAPQSVTVYEGVPFSVTLLNFIRANSWTPYYTGSEYSSFYLSAIGGLNLTGNRITDGIWAHIQSKGMSYSRTIPDDSILSEFSYGSGTGWMYSVNRVYKNYGFADYFAQDGDAVRVQFTLLLGDDLGAGGALGNGTTVSLLDDDPDYAPIMKLLAAVCADTQADLTVYNEALNAVSVWNLSQNVMNAQILKLKAAYDL